MAERYTVNVVEERVIVSTSVASVSVDASGGTTGLTFTGGPITTTGTLTLSGTLALANGGTGATTAAGVRTALSLVIGTNVQAWSAVLDSWAGKTVPTGTVVGTSDTQTLTNKSIDGATNTVTNVSLTTGVSGTLPIANGGTGQTTANAALNAILPAQATHAGKVLKTDGTNTSWEADNNSGTVTSVATSGLATGGPITTSGTIDVPAATVAETITGTSTAKALTPDDLAAIWERGSDIASASTLTIPSTGGGVFHVTGTTTITAISESTTKSGRHVWLIFDGALTLTHNATSLILPTGANITTAAEDSALFINDDGTNWRCIVYYKKNGQSLASSGGGAQTDIFTSSGTWTKNGTATTAYIICIGGGGGGGGGPKKFNAIGGGGGGGGGGGYTENVMPVSILGATETVTVGAGGAGGAAQATNSTNGNAGSAGGNTTFGTKTKAFGGGGGAGGTDSSAAGGAGGLGEFSGGAGGAGSVSTTTPGNTGAGYAASGGGGGTGSTAGSSTTAGAGGAPSTLQTVVTSGGAGGTPGGTQAGTAGTNTTANFPVGGAGGGGGCNNTAVNTAGAGGAGGKYGGGGGGGAMGADFLFSGAAGGAGAAGICVVIQV